MPTRFSIITAALVALLFGSFLLTGLPIQAHAEAASRKLVIDMKDGNGRPITHNDVYISHKGIAGKVLYADSPIKFTPETMCALLKSKQAPQSMMDKINEYNVGQATQLGELLATEESVYQCKTGPVGMCTLPEIKAGVYNVNAMAIRNQNVYVWSRSFMTQSKGNMVHLTPETTLIRRDRCQP